MPCVASLDDFRRAVTEFAVADPGMVIEPAARAAARRSLDCAGLLLLGEMHGVGENPLLIRALMEVILFDGLTGADWSWSQRGEAMAGRVLAASPPGDRTLVVAGNAHTPTSVTRLGVPLGARLARQRPGIREIRIRYRSGQFWNGGPRRFATRAGPIAPARLHVSDGELVLDLPTATEAVVPQRP